MDTPVERKKKRKTMEKISDRRFRNDNHLKLHCLKLLTIQHVGEGIVLTKVVDLQRKERRLCHIYINIKKTNKNKI